MAEIILSLKRTVFLPKGSPGIFSINNIKVDIRNPEISGENGKIFCRGDADILMEYSSQEPGSDLKRGIMVAEEAKPKNSQSRPWQALLTLPFELAAEGEMVCPPLSELSIGDIRWFVVAPRAIELEVALKLQTKEEDEWEGDYRAAMEKEKIYRPEAEPGPAEQERQIDLEDRVYFGLDDGEKEEQPMVEEPVKPAPIQEKKQPERPPVPAAPPQVEEKRPEPAPKVEVKQEEVKKEEVKKEKPGYIVLERIEVEKEPEQPEEPEETCPEEEIEGDREPCRKIGRGILELYDAPDMMDECPDEEEEPATPRRPQAARPGQGACPDERELSFGGTGSQKAPACEEIKPYAERPLGQKAEPLQRSEAGQKRGGFTMRLCRVLVGEDLEMVSCRTGVPVKELAARNRLQDGSLKEGTYLIIPD